MQLFKSSAFELVSNDSQMFWELVGFLYALILDRLDFHIFRSVKRKSNDRKEYVLKRVGGVVVREDAGSKGRRVAKEIVCQG